MKILLNRLGMLGLVSVMTMPAYADSCFQAKGELGADAQEIRQKAADMGWKVGTMASLAASSVVKSKVAIYPKGTVAICLAEDSKGKLAMKAQASSSDAGKAEWHEVPGKKLQ
jgi:hypothetical protein